MRAYGIAGLAAGLILSITLAGPAAADANWDRITAAAKKEGVVVAATSSLSGKASVAVINEAKKKTGLTLELVTGRMAVAQEKIQTEQKSHSYITDTMDSGGMSVLVLKKNGFLQSVAGDLPALREKDKFAHAIVDDPEGMMLNILEIKTMFFFNSDLIKPGEEPKSYRDLLNPKWKGKIFLTNPMYTTAPEEFMLAMTRANTGLDEKYFAALYKNAVVGGASGGKEAMDKLVRGEVAIAGFFPGNTALNPMRQGAHIKPLDLKEGYLSEPAKWGLLKNAPHANAAKVFANWLLSKDGQSFVTQATDLESVRNDVPSPLPFHLQGPVIRLSFQQLAEAEARREKNYMANLVGIKK